MRGLDYDFRWSIVVERWDLFLVGAWVDVWVSILGFGLACAIGLAVAILRLSGFALVALPAFAYVQVVRGVPLYVFLLWVYFGLATVLDIAFSQFQSIVIVLALTGSGGTAEIFRAGIAAIDRGQVEAATSLGLNRLQVYLDVVLPQALRIVVPPLGNIFIGLLKGATIMSVIAVPDMLHLAQEINVTYFVPFEAFTAVLVIFVSLVFLLSGLIFALERSLRLP